MPRESNQVIALKAKIAELNIEIEDNLMKLEEHQKFVDNLKNSVIVYEECLAIVTAKPKRIRKAKEAAPMIGEK